MLSDKEVCSSQATLTTSLMQPFTQHSYAMLLGTSLYINAHALALMDESRAPRGSVSCQGYFNMQTGGSRDQTSNLSLVDNAVYLLSCLVWHLLPYRSNTCPQCVGVIIHLGLRIC